MRRWQRRETKVHKNQNTTKKVATCTIFSCPIYGKICQHPKVLVVRSLDKWGLRNLNLSESQTNSNGAVYFTALGFVFFFEHSAVFTQRTVPFTWFCRSEYPCPPYRLPPWLWSKLQAKTMATDAFTHIELGPSLGSYVRETLVSLYSNSIDKARLGHSLCIAGSRTRETLT